MLREPYNRESRPARRRVDVEQQVTQNEEKTNSRLFNQFPIVSFKSHISWFLHKTDDITGKKKPICFDEL